MSGALFLLLALIFIYMYKRVHRKQDHLSDQMNHSVRPSASESSALIDDTNKCVDYFPGIKNLTLDQASEFYAQLLIEHGCCINRESARRRSVQLVEVFHQIDQQLTEALAAIDARDGREREDLVVHIECLESMLKKQPENGVRKKIEEKLASARGRRAAIDEDRQPALDRQSTFRGNIRGFANAFIAATLPLIKQGGAEIQATFSDKHGFKFEALPSRPVVHVIGGDDPVEAPVSLDIRAAAAEYKDAISTAVSRHQPAVRVLQILARLDGATSETESSIIFEFINRNGAGLEREHRDWFHSRQAGQWYHAPSDEVIDEAIADLRGLPLDYRIDIVGTAVAIVACGGSPKKREAEMLEKIRRIVSTDD